MTLVFGVLVSPNDVNMPMVGDVIASVRLGLCVVTGFTANGVAFVVWPVEDVEGRIRPLMPVSELLADGGLQ